MRGFLGLWMRRPVLIAKQPPRGFLHHRPHLFRRVLLALTMADAFSGTVISAVMVCIRYLVADRAQMSGPHGMLFRRRIRRAPERRIPPWFVTHLVPEKGDIVVHQVRHMLWRQHRMAGRRLYHRGLPQRRHR